MATNSVNFFLWDEGNGLKLHSGEGWLTLWIIKNWAHLKGKFYVMSVMSQ